MAVSRPSLSRQRTERPPPQTRESSHRAVTSCDRSSPSLSARRYETNLSTHRAAPFRSRKSPHADHELALSSGGQPVRCADPCVPYMLIPVLAANSSISSGDMPCAARAGKREWDQLSRETALARCARHPLGMAPPCSSCSKSFSWSSASRHRVRRAWPPSHSGSCRIGRHANIKMHFFCCHCSLCGAHAPSINTLDLALT